MHRLDLQQFDKSKFEILGFIVLFLEVKMRKDTKRVVYDGINISVKALTFFIAIGLAMIGILMAYGYLRGGDVDVNVAPDAEECISWQDDVG